MSDAKMNNVLEMVIIAILIGDILLEWKMVYGTYPWEGRAAS